jgi:hypothetical protein
MTMINDLEMGIAQSVGNPQARRSLQRPDLGFRLIRTVAAHLRGAGVGPR